MERLVDKLIVAACCCMALLFSELSSETVVGALLAVTVTALYEALRGRTRFCAALPLAFAACSVFVPAFAAFLPLAAYDCLREENWALRLAWAAALPFVFAWWPLYGIVAICISCALACLLSWRTNTIMRERAEYRRMRDNLQEATLSIEAKNRDLQASQDLQVRLAMLSERGRIAREIHDNVGHLLTRAIMQVEALQVVHADDPRTKADFNDVSATLHEAMDEVRASVHDLRDESIDTRGQLESAIAGCGVEQTRLDYQVGAMPANVGYCFLAVTREALSNTARHSDATSVEVKVVEHSGLYQIAIRDNGSHPPRPSDGSGMGLATMESRVRALGGTFRAEYRAGFHVLASIPKAFERGSDGAQPLGARASDPGGGEERTP